MENQLLQLQGVLTRFEDESFKNMDRLSQFTIDFIQTESYDASEFSGDVEAGLNHIGSLSYRVSTILEILREGIDKEFFERIYSAIKELDKD